MTYGGQLEQNPAELAGVTEGLQCVEEGSEHDAAGVPRRAVDAPPLVDRQPLAQLGRDLLELYRVPGHQAERLHVHHEPVRRSLGPAAHHLLRRDAVVRGVDFHRREVLGVPREAGARRSARRIPVLDERIVGPRARADADRGRHAVRSTS